MWEMLNVLLREPGSGVELALLILCSLLVMTWTLSKMAKAVGTEETSAIASFAITLAGLGLILVGMVATRFYLLPVLGSNGGYPILLGVALAGSHLLVVPLMCITQRATIMGAIISWVVSLCATALVIATISYGFSLVRGGAEDMGKTKTRTEEMDRFLRQQAGPQR